MVDLPVCFVADEQYQLPAGGVVKCLPHAQSGLCVQPPLHNQWLSIYKEPFQTCTLGDALGDHVLLLILGCTPTLSELMLIFSFDLKNVRPY